MIRPRGSLVVAGTGIRAPAQVTLETVARLSAADVVFTLVADPLTEYWVRSLNENTESLAPLYVVGKPRWQIYDAIVARVVERVRSGVHVCAVSYGHPGVFAEPLHRAVREIRAAGLFAEMLAGVSAEDNLFADLGLDPSGAGCRSFEATDFLLFRRPPDTSANLLLWQIGVIAEPEVKAQRSIWNLAGLEALRDTLVLNYPGSHVVTVYEAAHYSVGRPIVHRCALEKLPDAPVTALSTLFVPPLTHPSYDGQMAQRLGIDLLSAAWSARPEQTPAG